MNILLANARNSLVFASTHGNLTSILANQGRLFVMPAKCKEYRSEAIAPLGSSPWMIACPPPPHACAPSALVRSCNYEALEREKFDKRLMAFTHQIRHHIEEKIADPFLQVE